MTTIQIKYSNTPGHVPSSLLAGQLAINTADQILFFLDNDGVTINGFKMLSPQVVTMGAGDSSNSTANTAFVQGQVATINNNINNNVIGTPAPLAALNTISKLAAAVNNLQVSGVAPPTIDGGNF